MRAVLRRLNPPPGGGVGGYNHHDIGEEVEWRPPLLYANPSGNRIPATLKVCQKCIKTNQKRAYGAVRSARGVFVFLKGSEPRLNNVKNIIRIVPLIQATSQCKHI